MLNQLKWEKFTTNRTSLKGISEGCTPERKKMNLKGRSEMQPKMMSKDYHDG